MKLYRLMCDEEFNSVCEKHPFSWNKSCKWFTDDVEFLQRVSDKKFNNSKFKQDRYKNLVVYQVENLSTFERVSNKELMLRRKNAQNVKVINILKVNEVSL